MTTSYVTYLTAGAPFQAIVKNAGMAFVGVPDGVREFSPGNGGLASTCTSMLSFTLLNEEASMTNLSFLSNGADLATGIGSPGAFFSISPRSIAALPTATWLARAQLLQTRARWK